MASLVSPIITDRAVANSGNNLFLAMEAALTCCLGYHPEHWFFGVIHSINGLDWVIQGISLNFEANALVVVYQNSTDTPCHNEPEGSAFNRLLCKGFVLRRFSRSGPENQWPPNPCCIQMVRYARVRYSKLYLYVHWQGSPWNDVEALSAVCHCSWLTRSSHEHWQRSGSQRPTKMLRRAHISHHPAILWSWQ